MKKLQIIAIVCMLLFSACNNASEKNENAVADSTVSNVIADNGMKETETKDTPVSSQPTADTTMKAEDKKDAKEAESPSDKILVGKHNITLQWIGWNVPGSAIIEKADKDWYHIKAKQESKTGYLIVDGKLKPSDIVGDKILKLKFDGLIEYKEETINNNKPCSKRGEQEFISTQGRKYWRLQNMLNCDGITTDYVDIYF